MWQKLSRPEGAVLAINQDPTNTITFRKLRTLGAGTCRQLVVKLNDGSEHHANFKFR